MGSPLATRGLLRHSPARGGQTLAAAGPSSSIQFPCHIFLEFLFSFFFPESETTLDLDYHLERIVFVTT